MNIDTDLKEKAFIWFNKITKEFKILNEEQHRNKLFTIKYMKLAYNETKNSFLKTDHLIFIREEKCN